MDHANGGRLLGMAVMPQLLGQMPTLLGDLVSEVDAFVLKNPKPTSPQVTTFLQLYASGEPRAEAARALVARGVDANTVGTSLAYLGTEAKINWGVIWGILATISMAASAYHGYRRNQSIGWALWWGLMGTAFPVITPTVALAQGFGKRKAA